MKKLNNKFLLFFFSICVLFFTHTAFAANLSLLPSSGSYHVGDTISVRIVLSSSDQSANAVSGNLSFSKDVLTLNSISKSSSLISLWAQEPSYSNADGTVVMEGVILNGYTGSNGMVVTMSFRAKAVGTANVKFTSSSVLANDGQGTNILTNTGQASFSISPALVKEKPTSSTTPTSVSTPVKLLTPVFTDYSNNIKEGEFIVVKGSADPFMNVIINSDGVISSSNEVVHDSVTLKSDENGIFNYVSGRAMSGTYVITAQASNKDGVLSEKTLPIKILVISPVTSITPVVPIQTKIINIFSVVIPLIGLIILLILILIWGWYNIQHYREYMHKRLEHMKADISKNFEIMSKDIKKLSIDQLKKDLETAEKNIMVDIKETEK